MKKTKTKNSLIFAVIAALLVFLLSSTAIALEPKDASIDVKVKQTNYFLHAGETISIEFELANLYDGSDDGIISQVDLYLLDLGNAGLSVESFNGEGWQHEFIEQYSDNHFWIENASSQKLSATLKASESAVPGSYNIVAYFQFFDDEGETIGLGDNKALLPLNDSEKHYFTNVVILAPGEQAPAFTFSNLENTDFLLYAVTALIIAAVIAVLYFSKKTRKPKASKTKK